MHLHSGGGNFSLFSVRGRNYLAHTSMTGHTHLISRFLFFHLPSSGCSSIACNQFFHGLPPHSTISTSVASRFASIRLFSLVRHLSFVSFNLAVHRNPHEEWPGQLRLRWRQAQLFLDRIRSNCGNTISANK